MTLEEYDNMSPQEKADFHNLLDDIAQQEQEERDAKYIGMGRMQAVKEVMAEGKVARVIRDGDFKILEWSANRINLHVDETNTVIKVDKG